MLSGTSTTAGTYSFRVETKKRTRQTARSRVDDVYGSGESDIEDVDAITADLVDFLGCDRASLGASPRSWSMAAESQVERRHASQLPGVHSHFVCFALVMGALAFRRHLGPDVEQPVFTAQEVSLGSLT